MPHTNVLFYFSYYSVCFLLQPLSGLNGSAMMDETKHAIEPTRDEMLNSLKSEAIWSSKWSRLVNCNNKKWDSGA